ncbi:MAG: hypothetical protein C4K58_03655 [Flavobacteriaceae bacterium]|nr:MAG: hypothetical protein C4K58_03655 [Flavobacteriaceae bacterium]
MNSPQLSLVIPLYNEEQNAPLLISAIKDALVGFTYEIILIDDCSTDKTVEVIQNLKSPNVHLIELKKNYGQSSALSAGIGYASGEFIVTLDGDLQNDPTDIPAMLEKLKSEDLDIVAGIRAKRQDEESRMLPSLTSSVATVLPITIGNLGIRELTFTFCKEYLNYSLEIGLGISFWFFIASSLLSFCGIFVLWQGLKLSPKAEITP